MSSGIIESDRLLRVKLLSREPVRCWERQLPGSERVWGGCRFIFDRDERDYDWLVIYDDLPPIKAERRSLREEQLACHKQHTLLVTTEPSSIKAYGGAYVAQFGCVLTSQEEWALPHRDRIYSQPALRWFYGLGTDYTVSYSQMKNADPPVKTHDVSMVWSGKKERHTWHRDRYEFMRRIRDSLPGLDVYGRGVRQLVDKAEALDSYRYHIAIENHVGLHHWTEKLADAFLGFTLPFYFGCPNAEDYFPAESFIRIDIMDFEKALRTIVDAVRNNEYEMRLPYIIEARRRVLEEYNLMAVLSREIMQRNVLPVRQGDVGGRILSRYALRKKFPLLILKDACEKARSRLIHVMRSSVSG